MADEKAEGSKNDKVKFKKFNQIVGCIAVSMGVFCLGTTVGWSSPAQEILTKDGVTEEQFPHISSIMCLGATAVQLHLFLTFDRIGRKWTFITLAIPVIIANVLIGVINNWIIFLVGRFILGFCGGGLCVALPSYVSEYAHKNIRGCLVCINQVFLVSGILASYTCGLFKNRYILCLPMVVPPTICIVMMVFLPESPVFLRMKKKDDKARKALTFYRGKDYDITQEMKDIEDYIKSTEGSFKESMKQRANIKGFIILLVMHVLQQLVGINAIMFYTASIFNSGSFFGLSSDVCCCILSVVQIITSIVSSVLVDRLGRKMLWFISLGIMAVCLTVCGVYFIIKLHHEDFSKKVEFILIIATYIYIVGFCCGAGPLPWFMIGEMLSASAKNVIGPIASAVNWLLAYGVTASFPYLDKAIGAGPVFLGYAVVCVLGFVFVFFVVIETKGKTLDEIQQEMGKDKIK